MMGFQEQKKAKETKICQFFKLSFSLPKIKKNVENTSLDKCHVLKKAFEKKENFLVCELEESAAKISSLQDTVSVMQHCVADENITFINIKNLMSDCCTV